MSKPITIHDSTKCKVVFCKECLDDIKSIVGKADTYKGGVVKITKYPNYKGNYKGKLLQPILKHTKVRRPMSGHITDPRWQPHYIYGSLVQDISKGLENPLGTGTEYPYRKQDMFAEFVDMDSIVIPKPSLLTKLKNRFKK